MAILYCAFALFILALVFFSVSNPIQLVEEEYYEKELLYQDQINKIRRTRALPAGLEIRYSATRNQISITFPSSIGEVTKGRATLFRPSDSRLDQTLKLEPDSAGLTIIDSEAMASGMWRLIVEWTVDSLEYYDEEILVLR